MLLLRPQAQHVAESALLKREVATKTRQQADAAAQELDRIVLEREELTASVADLQRTLTALQSEDSTFSCEHPAHRPLGEMMREGSVATLRQHLLVSTCSREREGLPVLHRRFLRWLFDY